MPESDPDQHAMPDTAEPTGQSGISRNPMCGLSGELREPLLVKTPTVVGGSAPCSTIYDFAGDDCVAPYAREHDRDEDRLPQRDGSESDCTASEAIGGSPSTTGRNSAPDHEVQRLEQNILGLLQGYRLQMVEIGAAGRLLVSGEMEDVFPLEDEEPLNAANPVAADGQVRLDALKVQARQEAIVKNVLKKGSFGLVILGGDHDLSENVRRLGEGKCEPVRVSMEQFKYASGE